MASRTILTNQRTTTVGHLTPTILPYNCADILGTHRHVSTRHHLTDVKSRTLRISDMAATVDLVQSCESRESTPTVSAHALVHVAPNDSFPDLPVHHRNLTAELT